MHGAWERGSPGGASERHTQGGHTAGRLPTRPRDIGQAESAGFGNGSGQGAGRRPLHALRASHLTSELTGLLGLPCGKCAKLLNVNVLEIT